MMRTASLSGLLVAGFLAWAFIAPDPTTRIERACSPVVWLGNISVSFVALTASDFQDSVQGAFTRMDYGCRYAIWRLFYEQEYLEVLKAQESGFVPGSAAEQKGIGVGSGAFVDD